MARDKVVMTIDLILMRSCNLEYSEDEEDESGLIPNYCRVLLSIFRSI